MSNWSVSKSPFESGPLSHPKGMIRDLKAALHQRRNWCLLLVDVVNMKDPVYLTRHVMKQRQQNNLVKTSSTLLAVNLQCWQAAMPHSDNTHPTPLLRYLDQLQPGGKIRGRKDKGQHFAFVDLHKKTQKQPETQTFPRLIKNTVARTVLVTAVTPLDPLLFQNNPNTVSSFHFWT